MHADPKRHVWSVPALLLAAIVACGLHLRTADLGLHSLWLDELYSVRMATTGRVSAWLADAHPPLYYLLLKGWAGFATSDWWMRFLSVVLGTATIPVVYLIAVRLFSRRAGLAAALLMATLSLHIAYSQEARMYTALVFFFAVGLLGAVQASAEASRSGWLLLFFGALCTAYSHGIGPLYSAVLLGFYVAMAWAKGRRPAWNLWIVACAALAVLYAPWALNLSQLTQSGQMVFWEKTPTWSRLWIHIQELTLGDVPPLSAVLANQFSLKVPETPGWLWQLPIMITLIMTLSLRQDRKVLLSLMAVYLLPVLVIFLVSLVRAPIYGVRVTLPVCVPLVLLLGATMDLPRPFARLGYLLFTVVVVLFSIGTFYDRRYNAPKEEWREALAYLSESVGREDLLVFNVDGPSRFIVSRYGEGLVEKGVAIKILADEMKVCDRNADACLDDSVLRSGSGVRYWFVNSHEEFVLSAPSIAQWKLGRMSCTVPRSFVGLTVESCRARNQSR